MSQARGQKRVWLAGSAWGGGQGGAAAAAETRGGDEQREGDGGPRAGACSRGARGEVDNEERQRQERNLAGTHSKTNGKKNGVEARGRERARKMKK